MRATHFSILLGVFGALTALGGSANAKVQTHGPEVWPGKNEIAIHTGFEVGHAIAEGFRLTLDYAYRVADHGKYSIWLNFGGALIVGGGCDINAPGVLGCAGWSSGDAVEPFGGVKFKFKTPIPLVPYAKANIVFDYVWNTFNYYAFDNTYCGSNGVLPGVRGAGGANYFLTKNIGVGLETGLTFGPAVYFGCGGPNHGSHVAFAAGFDMSAGAEFVF